ncbi:hypothetical protein [Parasedimentitalea psychrophila]|uniref:Uncharacterized protein n=2 Tax=Parasedimentitalea psychrophila TaxID=2997337 RepID=A0A9Y2P4A8_9RHOB|nr:hypothetical protein [Parasedimentitalea psychrophila]WIY25124.1 hypothetical protein QPJ95_21975 [Parasedimentitalea psychrophila]
MARLLVKFTQGYSRYNKGDTAAFGADVARKLCEGKGKVAKLMGDAADPDAGKSVLIGKVDTREVQEIVDQARTELQGRSQTLDERENSLSQQEQVLFDREAALATREADLASRETALSATAEPADTKAKTDGKKTSGEPPKQGAKT